MSAYFERLDEHRYRATTRTRGPWSRDHQHGGPPAALLGTLLEQRLAPARLVRLTFEILRPVPIADLTTSVEVLRPGRRVALGRATLAADDGPVMSVQGWRIRERDVDLAPDRPDADPAVEDMRIPGPEGADVCDFFPVDWDDGYHRSIEARSVRGGFTEAGDAVAWIRPLVPVVAGTELTPLQRVLVAGDSGNGLSSRLDIARWLYVNTDLTVHLREPPQGEWVGLDARTRFGPDGIGLATTALHGAQGPIGTALQSLIVEPR